MSHLRRSQRAEIAELMGASGLAASEFEWDVAEPLSLRWPRLRHRPTRSYFTFATGRLGPGRTAHHLEFSPGQESSSGSVTVRTWDEVLQVFDRWLRWVKEERDAPSFWEAFRSSDPEPAIESGEELFTADEAARLQRALDEAREVLETSAPSDALGDIRAEIEDLKRRVSKLERRAWWNLATGAFVNLMLRALVSPEAAKQALHLVGRGIRQVTHLPPAP